LYAITSEVLIAASIGMGRVMEASQPVLYLTWVGGGGGGGGGGGKRRRRMRMRMSRREGGVHVIQSYHTNCSSPPQSPSSLLLSPPLSPPSPLPVPTPHTAAYPPSENGTNSQSYNSLLLLLLLLVL